MKEITVRELKSKMDNNESYQLIDVREAYECDICTLNGELIPMGEIMASTDKISKDKPVIIYCRSGNRSATVIQYLEKTHDFSNLYNLKGGILAYADEIDPNLTKY